MMAASARRSGTTVPFSSSLNWGVCASFSCRAAVAALAARALASRARRVAAEVVAFFFLAGSLRAPLDDPVGAAVACRLVDAFGAAAVWADIATGVAITAEAAKAQISRAFQNSRARI